MLQLKCVRSCTEAEIDLFNFSGSKYWMYNAGQVPPVDRKYPLEISSWDGIPDDVEAAFMAPNGHTYFFKGGNYWRYDDKAFSVR